VQESTPMEDYLDSFLSQELLCKYGMTEAWGEDGKRMEMPAVAFYCARAEAVPLLMNMRDAIANPVAEAGPEKMAFLKGTDEGSRYDKGLGGIELVDTVEVNVKGPGGKEIKSLAYIVRVQDGDGTSWSIKKRYSQFLELHKQLCNAPGIGPKVLGYLPGRHLNQEVAKKKGAKKARKMQKKAIELERLAEKKARAKAAEMQAEHRRKKAAAAGEGEGAGEDSPVPEPEEVPEPEVRTPLDPNHGTSLRPACSARMLTVVLACVLQPEPEVELDDPVVEEEEEDEEDIKAEALAERRKAVESYLVLATMHPMVTQSAHLHSFVNSDKQDIKVTKPPKLR
jgi:hypothetical protein